MTLPRILLPFADGVYAFALHYGRLLELQDLTNAGPMELYRRVLGGDWRFQDIRETIRLGLLDGKEGWIGADLGEDGQPIDGVHVEMTPSLANKLVRNYVDTYGAPAVEPGDTPPPGQKLTWQATALLAAQILGAGLSGVADEPLGKKTSGEGEKTSPFLTVGGDGLVFSPASQAMDGAKPT